MKYQLFIFVVAGILTVSQAFSQESFPDETISQKWEYVTWYFWGGQCEQRIIKNGEKLEVCENEYVEIFDCNELESNCRLIGYYRLTGDSVLVRSVGYWNEVEYVDSADCSKPNDLMYDFGSQGSDTIHCAMNTSYGPFQKIFWVDGIAQIDYVGTERETRTMRYIPYPNSPNVIFTMDWIQGIGSNAHPFYSLGCIGDHCEHEQQLTKVYRENALIYRDTILTFSFPCNGWMTSTDEIPRSTLNLAIRPNPASTSFMISANDRNDGLKFSLRIYDELGRMVVSKSEYFADERIDLSNMHPGIYFVRITHKAQYQIVKLIVQ